MWNLVTVMIKLVLIKNVTSGQRDRQVAPVVSVWCGVK
jgi:hypothetical protein